MLSNPAHDNVPYEMVTFAERESNRESDKESHLVETPKPALAMLQALPRKYSTTKTVI